MNDTLMNGLVKWAKPEKAQPADYHQLCSINLRADACIQLNYDNALHKVSGYRRARMEELRQPIDDLKQRALALLESRDELSRVRALAEWAHGQRRLLLAMRGE